MSTAGSAPPATLPPRNRRFSAGNRYGVALALLVLTYIQALYVQRDTFGSASVRSGSATMRSWLPLSRNDCRGRGMSTRRACWCRWR